MCTHRNGEIILETSTSMYGLDFKNMIVNFRFSLQEMFLCLSLCACLFGVSVFYSFPASLPVAVCIVVTLFTVFHLQSDALKCSDAPSFAGYSLLLAYYAFALALATLVAFGIDQVIPHSLHLAEDATFWDLISGRALAQAIEEAIRYPVALLLLFTGFSVTTMLFSIPSLRHSRLAKWLTILSAPGVILAVVCVVSW